MPGAVGAATLVGSALALVVRTAAPEPALMHFAPEPKTALAEGAQPGATFAPWAQALGPIVVRNANTETEESIRLYANDGDVDAQQALKFSFLACDGRFGGGLKTRVIQLAVKAAYHFHANKMVIVSAYRPMRRGKGGYHALGQAIDFWLPGVDFRQLAAYLRTLPKVGVGAYTHPATHFVHVDARDQSYHWLDASPPGVTWHEKQLGDPGREARDATYTLQSDLPI